MRLSDAVEALAAATAARDAMLALAARDFVDMVAEARAKYDALRVEMGQLQAAYQWIIWFPNCRQQPRLSRCRRR